MDALKDRVAERVGAAQPLLLALANEFTRPGLEISVACAADLRLGPKPLEALEQIVREALANAVTHAFPPREPGRVWITLADERGRCRLKIADSGPGYPELSGRACPGLDLIERLSRSLGGYCRLDNRNYGGAEVTVVFPATAAG